MKLVVEMRSGSHLYGTATPLSDLDYKGVYVPNARDILLQRVQNTISQSRPKASGEKNTAGDVDREIYSLQRYLELLSEGQMVALDMLFAPDSAMVGKPGPVWREIQANADRLVTRRAALFVRYCRQQANKYGIKGSRIAAARAALAMLVAAEADHGSAAKLSTIETQMAAFAGTAEHASLPDMEMPGGRLVRHLEICGRKMPFTGSSKARARSPSALSTRTASGRCKPSAMKSVDWKALSHAVRVGREALELLQTGRIIFPLSRAAELLAIKRGERPYAAVAEEIEWLLEAVQDAATRSTLRDEPDRNFIDGLVERTYRASVLEAERP